ncbi:unnamed protein product [Chrysoparadoxa australica]
MSTGEKRKADEMSGTVTTTLTELTAVCQKAVEKLGYDAEQAKVLVEVMMFSQVRGGNQGIIKIITNGLTKDPEAKDPVVEHEHKLCARINGNKSVGMVVLMKATDMAIEKAKAHGFGMAGTNNTFTSTGSLGAYVKKIADAGLIGFGFAQSPEFVAPYGSYQAILGTNPIAVGIPRKDAGPMVLDMATAAYPFFGLLEAKTAGKPIPGDVAYDSEGNLTTDPAAAIAGAIRVFDRSYKGSNLSLMVELLAGSFVGAATNDKKAAKNWGNLVFAIDPAMMGDVGEFQAGMEVVFDRIKTAKKLPGVTQLMLPGERGGKMAAAVADANSVTLEKNLYDSIVKFAS